MTMPFSRLLAIAALAAATAVVPMATTAQAAPTAHTYGCDDYDECKNHRDGEGRWNKDDCDDYDGGRYGKNNCDHGYGCGSGGGGGLLNLLF